jgi:hypothetical protein
MAALELDHLAVPLESFPAIIPQPTAKQSLRQNHKDDAEGKGLGLSAKARQDGVCR